MEVPTSSVEVSHSSEGEGLGETSGEGSALTEGEHEVGEQNDNVPSLASATRSVALEQSTLASYRAQVLPNLAKAALERLQKRNSEDSEFQNSDFQPPKKRRMEENCQSEEENEGQTCSICFEPWSNSGNHRISSLKCGHLFGLNCIEKWIKGGGGGKCPQCNAPAKKGDIRVIYSKAISVVDTTDRDRALKELEEEKRLRIAAQKAEAQAVIQYQLARTECDRLNEEIKQLRTKLESYDGLPTPGGGMVREKLLKVSDMHFDEVGQYVLCKTIKISDIGKARVMAHNPFQSMIVVSKPSTTSLVPAYGLAKLSTVDLRHSEYVGIHGDVIRDVAFSPSGDGMILTASMDKKIQLTSMHANAVVQRLLCQPGPVHGIMTMPTISVVDCKTGQSCFMTSETLPVICAGLLVGSLDGCVFWEKARSDPTSYNPHILHTLPEGACVCVSFESYSRHCLASFRPSRRYPNCRHTLFQLNNIPSDQPMSCQLIHQFQAGSTYRLLSRSKLFQRPRTEDKILAAFGDEATKSVHLWDVSTTTSLQQLSMSSTPALDLLPFGSANEQLAVLTESKLFIYKWQ